MIIRIKWHTLFVIFEISPVLVQYKKIYALILVLAIRFSDHLRHTISANYRALLCMYSCALPYCLPCIPVSPASQHPKEIWGRHLASPKSRTHI